MRDLDNIMKVAKEKGVGRIDLRTTDFLGRVRQLSLPLSQLSPKLFSEGVGVDASNYGLAGVAESDMVLLPDPKSAFVDATEEPPTLVFLAETALPGGKTCPCDPRGIARRAEKYLLDSGIADEIRIAVELEFYLFAEILIENTPTFLGYEVIPHEALPGILGGSYPSPQTAYHALNPFSYAMELRNEVVRNLEAWGIPIRYHHHESGSLGQQEIELEFGTLRQAADWVILARDLIRRLAAKKGLCASFLPKPLSHQAGSGLHVHQYLSKKGRSLFHAHAQRDLSQEALAYIGGLLCHGRSLAAWTNPSTNSYRRLVPGFEAPVYLAFGRANRTAAVRIPAYAAETTRVELRTPDPLCNPYLAFSAILMAGLDGICRRIDPIAKGWGPYEEEVYHLPVNKRCCIYRLPRTLWEALEALGNDQEYLTKGGVFPEEAIYLWVKLKREEAKQVASRPHPYEHCLYKDW